MSEADNSSQDPRMDADNLYREETVSDLKVGTIRVLTPITAEGERDEARDVQYIGQASLYTPAGALPLNFELEASTLAEAVAAFEAGAKKSMDETMERLREMRREQASSLYVPGQGGAGGGGMGGPGGQGGGGIQMP